MSQRSDYKVNIIITSKDKTGQASKTAKKGMFDLAKAAQVAAVAFGILKTAQAAVKFVKAGAAIGRQRDALNNLAKAAGTSATAIVSAIQMASDHTIDRMTAMSAANKALLLGVAKTPEQFSELTRVATLLGRAMGQDAATSINDFVVAAGRQSVMIADNLGLMVSAETANQRYADSHGILVTSMDKTQKSQAFLNEMLIQGAEKTKALETSTLSAADKIEQAEAALSDIKSSLAELTAEFALSVGTLDHWAAGLAGWSSAIDNARVASEHFEDQAERDRLAMERAIRATDKMNVTRRRSADLIEMEIDNSAEQERMARRLADANGVVETSVAGLADAREIAIAPTIRLRTETDMYNKLAIQMVIAMENEAKAMREVAAAAEVAQQKQLKLDQAMMRSAANFTDFLGDKSAAAAGFAKSTEEIETEHQERLAKIAKRGQTTAVKINLATEQEKLDELKWRLGQAELQRSEFTGREKASTVAAKDHAIEQLREQVTEQTTLIDDFNAGRLLKQGENVTELLTAEEARYQEELRLLEEARAEQELEQKQSLGRMMIANFLAWAEINKVGKQEIQDTQLFFMEKYGLISEEGAEMAREMERHFALIKEKGVEAANEIANRINLIPKTVDVDINFNVRQAGKEAAIAEYGYAVPGVVPGYAAGGVSSGGRALVGELGPEFVDLPRGSMVHNANTTSNMMNSQNTYNVNDPAAAAMMAEQARLASMTRFARGAGM